MTNGYTLDNDEESLSTLLFLPNITYLSFQRCNLTDNTIFKYISNIETIEVLRLSGNPFKDCKLDLHTFTNLKGLKTLVLYDTEIQINLNDLLNNCLQLQHLLIYKSDNFSFDISKSNENSNITHLSISWIIKSETVVNSLIKKFLNIACLFLYFKDFIPIIDAVSSTASYTLDKIIFLESDPTDLPQNFKSDIYKKRPFLKIYFEFRTPNTYNALKVGYSLLFPIPLYQDEILYHMSNLFIYSLPYFKLSNNFNPKIFE